MRTARLARPPMRVTSLQGTQGGQSAAVRQTTGLASPIHSVPHALPPQGLLLSPSRPLLSGLAGFLAGSCASSPDEAWLRHRPQPVAAVERCAWFNAPRRQGCPSLCRLSRGAVAPDPGPINDIPRPLLWMPQDWRLVGRFARPPIRPPPTAVHPAPPSRHQTAGWQDGRIGP